MEQRTATLGIDLGGTNTKLGLLINDHLHCFESFATQSYRAREEILDDIVRLVKRLELQALELGAKVSSLGIGVPATLDLAKGQTLIMPNFAQGWFGFKIVDYLQQATGLKTSVLNDARAFVLAESSLGAGKPYRHVFGMIVGTGIGGGIVIDKQLHLGKAALAGEIGHHIVEPYGLRCGCGSIGCLETVASAPALVASMSRAFLHGRSPILHKLSQGDLNKLSAEIIASAARQGDVACLEAFEKIGHYLAIASANVFSLLAPDCIILGGGLSGASDLLFPVIRQKWQSYLNVAGTQQPDLLSAELEQSGLIGAALYARQTFTKESL